jgi:hypothetical protein
VTNDLPIEALKPAPWIGVDLDGTLARYDTWKHILNIGEPIWPMVERVKQWLSEGKCIKIMTARITPPYYGAPGITTDMIVSAIQDWTEAWIGQRLEVTATKDLHMIELWDDRCVQVEPNIGEPVTYWQSRVA